MTKNIKYAVLILMLLLPISAKALGPLSFGIKGGLTAPDFNKISKDGKYGYHAGLFLDLNLPANFMVMTEVTVISKGAYIKRINEELGYNALYLQVPIRLAYGIKLPGSKLVLDAGPYWAYRMSDNLKYEEEGANLFKFKKGDLGISASVGFHFLRILKLRAGYDWGLSNITSDKINKSYNRNINISLGVKLF